MHAYIPRVWFLLAAALWSASCVRARIQVIDERTALENQILGSYQELDRDLQMVASVRAVDAQGQRRGPPSFTEIRARAVAARQTQQFQLDDVEELKNAGCLGETRTNRLAGRPCPLLAQPDVAARIERLVQAENDARADLLAFVLATSPDLTETDRKQLAQTWARMNHEQARPGHWIENDQGEWARK